MYKLRRFINRIHKIIRWIPVIWRDEDYDSYFIFEILKTKLTTVSRYFSDSHELSYVNQERDKEIVDTCIRLINRIQNDYYETEMFDYYMAKYAFKPVSGNSYKMVVEEEESNLDTYFSKNKLLHKKIVMELESCTKIQHDDYSIASRMSWEKQLKAKRILFKLLDNNIENWWI